MFKVLRKIKALFHFKGELKEMVVDRAEIKKDCVYLHPADDPDHTFRIKTETVEIFINPDGEVSEEDIFMIDNKKEQKEERNLVKEGGEERQIGADPNQVGVDPNPIGTEPNPIGTEPNPIDRKVPEDARDHFSSLLTASQRKRKISFTLYQDEYDFVQEHFKTHGYKRTEYFLACISSAKKTSMNASYRNFINIRAERKRQERTQVQNADGKTEGETVS